jgi:excisionase family DNA binding protein
MSLSKLMTIDELSTYPGVPAKTLESWRHDGVGPTFTRVGRHIRYSEDHVQEWLDTNDSRQRDSSP